MSSFEAVLPLPTAAQYLASNLQAARRLFEMINPSGTEKAKEKRGDFDASGVRPDLAVKELYFCYSPSEPPALDGVSFTLPQGKCLAIVGPSGAGKTTLVNVLLRFWDYVEGQILLNGRDLRQYDPKAVRQQLGVVSQNTYLFNETIRDNLLLARPTATQAELEEAARLAQLDGFIQSLPQGYGTWIGEHGLRLSGGERQRLAIARALLKNAPLLVLDEPTANLDTITEQQVLRTIHTLMQGRSTLLITHRLVGLEQADEILVMQAGRVVQRGQHAELLQVDGLYRQMWTWQNQVL
jgi:ABC-type multidrug transport system fused ATPase/permease subunit